MIPDVPETPGATGCCTCAKGFLYTMELINLAGMIGLYVGIGIIICKVTHVHCILLILNPAAHNHTLRLTVLLRSPSVLLNHRHLSLSVNRPV